MCREDRINGGPETSHRRGKIRIGVAHLSSLDGSWRLTLDRLVAARLPPFDVDQGGLLFAPVNIVTARFSVAPNDRRSATMAITATLTGTALAGRLLRIFDT
jgi:hypothetical protein